MASRTPSFVDQLLDILDREQAAGRVYADLSPENRRWLYSAAAEAPPPVAARPAVPPSQPSSVPVPVSVSPSAPALTASRAAAPPVAEPRHDTPSRSVPAAPVAAAPPAPAAPPSAPARQSAPSAPVPSARSPLSVPTPGLPNLDHYDLHSLADLVRPCRRCKLCEQRRQTVFGDGNPEAELMFIGEGPGVDEDAQGIPFVGESGELLNRIIQAMTYSREEVYIANIVKCRPPGNRNPEPAEIAACLPYLHRQIALVRPKVLVLLGAVPLRGLIDDRCRITRDRGVWMEYDGIPVMPTFHPAYILRVPKAKREVWTDMQAVMQLLGRGPASGG